MDGKKVYTIQINGISDSISAVNALNKQLDALESRIKTLEKNSSVSVKTQGGGNASALSEEEAAQREINKLKKEGATLDAKIVAAQNEVYKKVDATKQLYKETIADQKAIAAQERLVANEYSNTMVGMKQKLADIKAVINTTDLGDADSIKRMTQEANELTNKLKEMEQAYGQFGRNVGNYANGVAEGLQKIKVEVGAISREFSSTREATRTLNNELRALENNGKGNTQQAKNLRNAIYNLNSVIKDATVSSKAMDNAMDFMQSFTAMASMGNGLKSFFGIDDTEITRSIQKLVALQGVLNGLETLRRQMDTREGIGKILGRGFDKIDTWTYSLRRLNVQLRGTGTNARIAAAGIKVLNLAVKGLMTLGLAVGIDLLAEGFQKLVGAVKNFVKGDADLVSSMDVVNNAINTQNRILSKNLELINNGLSSGYITSSQARVLVEKEYAKALDDTNKRLKERAELIATEGINRSDLPNITGLTNLDSVIGDKGTTWIGGFKEGIKTIDDFIKRWDDLENAVSNNKGLDRLFNTASDARDELSHLAKLVERDFLNAINKFSDGTDKGTRALVDYIDKMDKLTSGRYSRAIQLVKVDDEGLQKELDNAWDLIQSLRDKVSNNPITVRFELNAQIEQELDKLDPTRAMQRNIDKWTQMLVLGIDDAGNKLTETQRKNIEKIVSEQKKALNKQRQQRIDSERNNGKKLAKEQERVEKELNELRIQNMKDGLEKTLAQLAEERRQKLKEARITGIRVGELTTEINKLYNKKVEEAQREHAQEVAAIYEDMWEQIQRTYDNNVRMNFDSQLTDLEIQLKKAEEQATKIFEKRYASYGGTKFDNRATSEFKNSMGYLSAGNWEEGAKEYLDLLDKINILQAKINRPNSFDGLVIGVEELEEELGKAEEQLKNLADGMEMSVKEYKDLMEGSYLISKFIQDNYTKDLTTAVKIRLDEARQYYDEIEKLEKKYSENVKNNEMSVLLNEKNTAEIDENNRYEQQLAQLEENREKGLLTEKRYNELSEEAQIQHEEAMKQIQTRYDSESARIEQDHMERLKNITAEGMRGILNEYRDAFDAISKIQSRQPQLMKGGLGDMGIINFGLTKKNYQEALDSYKELSRQILDEKNNLQRKFKDNEISFDDFQQAKRELDGLTQDCADAAFEVQENLERLGGDWWGSIDQWIQQAGQAITTILSSLSEITSNQYEQQISQQEEYIDKYKELLDKQKEITERYTDSINSIEEELATSRGDRRQHLIDQLNAETEARKASAAEEKRLAREQEKAEKKKKKLEYDQAVAKKKMDLAQAAINASMAVSMAAVNKWPLPAIPMMALAAAVGAAQIAAVASQNIPKPYAKGGVIQGKSHAQGGVKVLGGQAEVEGGEFITNKVTTAKNVDLLEYINSKKKKVDINDLIDFYSSGKIKKNITSMSPRTKFADGGVVPTLTNDYQFDDRLLSAFEDYSNRPVYVSVVDINNKQDDVRRVQALAGISD